MTFFALLFLVVKAAAAGWCTLFSYLNTRHVTAPKLVWYLFFTAYLIWLVQTCLNGWAEYHSVDYPALIDTLNDNIFQLAKLFLLMGAAVIMNQTYRSREENIWTRK
jgi:hypothetical protein